MLLTTLILAVEEGAEGIALWPDMAELIWGLVAFLLLMAAMFKFVFPKLNQTLEDRGAVQAMRRSWQLARRRYWPRPPRTCPARACPARACPARACPARPRPRRPYRTYPPRRVTPSTWTQAVSGTTWE
jgi:hypothetical protein